MKEEERLFNAISIDAIYVSPNNDPIDVNVADGCDPTLLPQYRTVFPPMIGLTRIGACTVKDEYDIGILNENFSGRNPMNNMRDQFIDIICSRLRFFTDNLDAIICDDIRCYLENIHGISANDYRYISTITGNYHTIRNQIRQTLEEMFNMKHHSAEYIHCMFQLKNLITINYLYHTESNIFTHASNLARTMIYSSPSTLQIGQRRYQAETEERGELFQEAISHITDVLAKSFPNAFNEVSSIMNMIRI